MDGGREVAELVDQVVDTGEPLFTRLEVAAKAGMDPEVAHRFWRAAGFPEVGDEVVLFSNADIRTLQGIKNLLDSGIVDMDIALEITRAIGQTTSRLAAAEISVLRERVSRPPVTEAGIDPEGAQEALQLASSALPFLESALVYLWRRHLSASAKRALLTVTMDQPIRSVGFVDMTRFSAASQSMSATDLARLINSFEATAFDTVAEFGGRVVKLIGDEVLFAADDPKSAASIALTLVERLEDDPEVPRVRSGLSHGPVVEIQGDVFGDTVNLASRLTEAAKPGSVVVSEAFKEALNGAADLEFRRIRRIAVLKGVGKVKAYVLRAAADGDAQRVP
jgi:adenylate cyclase